MQAVPTSLGRIGQPAAKHARFWGYGRVASAARAALSQRLTHFVLLGALIFAIAPRPASRSRDIVITRSALDALHAAEARRLGAASLSQDKVREVDERAIEDEILFHEAARLGLDRDDPIVRQRLIQKVLFLAEDLGGASRAPTEPELRAYYEARQGDRRRPPGYHFVQVFAVDEARLAALTPKLDPAAVAPPNLGDAFPYAREARLREDDVASLYDAAFAEALSKLPVGVWSGPIRSRFGWHEVRILEREEAGPASFDDVRADLALEYTFDRRRAVVAAFLRRAFADYDIEVAGEKVTHIEPARRVAPRSEASAED